MRKWVVVPLSALALVVGVAVLRQCGGSSSTSQPRSVGTSRESNAPDSLIHRFSSSSAAIQDPREAPPSSVSDGATLLAILEKECAREKLDVDQMLPIIADLTKILQESSDRNLLGRVSLALQPGRPKAVRGIVASLLAVTGKGPECNQLLSMIEEGISGLAALAAGARAFEAGASGDRLQEYWIGYFIWVTGRGYLRTTYEDKLNVSALVPQDRWKPETQSYMSAFWSRVGSVSNDDVTRALVREISTLNDVAYATDLLSRHLNPKNPMVLNACLELVHQARDRHVRGLALGVVGQHLEKKEIFDSMLSWYHTERPEGEKAYMAHLLMRYMPSAQAADFAAREYERDIGRTMHSVFIDALWQSDLPEAKDSLQTIVIRETSPVAGQYALKRLVESNRFTEREKVVALLQRVDDPRPSVRLFCLNSLVTLQGSEAMPRVKRLAEEDPDPSIRTVAAQHLIRLQESSSPDDR